MTTTTFTPKRVVNGVPLTERDSRTYEYGQVRFTHTRFWYGEAPDGQRTEALFTLTDAVQWARANGWIIAPDTCRWCSGHGFLRVPQDYFHLVVCDRCEGEGIDPEQPAGDAGVTA